MDVDDVPTEKDKNNVGIKQYYIGKVEELQVGAISYFFIYLKNPKQILLVTILYNISSMLLSTVCLNGSCIERTDQT